MRAYSQDLRDRVLAALKAGAHTQKAIAALFGVSLSTVEKWWHQKRTTGQTTPHPQTHGPHRTLHAYAPFLRTEIQKQPDATLTELCTRVAQVHHAHSSPSMMCRELQQLHLPRKKSPSTPVSETRRACEAFVASSKSGSARSGAAGSAT